MHTMNNYRVTLTTIAAVLAFIVVVLGAYTRLTNAGLGCPDWPGCYGHLVLNQSEAHPGQTINVVAAWTEMIHRYCAGSLAILIFIIATIAWLDRKRGTHSLWVPMMLVTTVIFQAALGMWTVTLKLLPVVVMGHLLGGLTTLSLLWCHRLQLSVSSVTAISSSERKWLRWYLIGLIILISQIILGAWVSTNYAGLSCIGFPTCNGEWLPSLNLSEAFRIVTKIGPNYEGGLLDSTSRITILFVHRCGAFLTTGYLLLMSVLVIQRVRSYQSRRMIYILLFLLAVQFGLGIINVLYLLPLSTAVAHNGVAALLLLCMVSLTYFATVNRGEWFHG